MFDEKFWLAIAFFAFLGLMLKYVLPLITKQLDDKSKQVADELAAAKEMKEKAEKLFNESEKHYQESLAFAEKLIKDAAIEAQKFFDETRKLAEVEISKKMSALTSRVKHEEEQAVREMKVRIIDAAIQVVQADMQNNAKKSQLSGLNKRAVDDISKLVH